MNKLSEDILVNIALYSGETALIEVASWAVPAHHRQIVRIVANGPKDTNKLDIKNLLSYGISKDHWMQFRYCWVDDYARQLANSTKWCPQTIEALFDAGIINPARFFASKYTLRNLCMAFPDFIDFYCNFMVKRPDIKDAAVCYANKKRLCTFVLDSRLIGANKFVFAFDDPECIQKWQTIVDNDPHEYEIESAYIFGLCALFKYGQYKMLMKQYLPVPAFNESIFKKHLSPNEDIQMLQNVMAKFSCATTFKIGTNNVMAFYELKKELPNIELDEDSIINIINKEHLEAFKLLNNLGLIHTFHLIAGACRSKSKSKFSIAALRMLQNKFLNDVQFKELLDTSYTLISNYIVGSPHCDSIVYWLWLQCPNHCLEQFIKMIDWGQNIVKYHSIVKEILRGAPSIKFDIERYDPNELRRHELIDNNVYVEEKLKKCNAAEFEAYFDKWSIEGHEHHIELALLGSLTQWIHNDDASKMTLIVTEPRFFKFIGRDTCLMLLSYGKYKNNRWLPFPIEVICSIITKLEIIKSDDVFYKTLDLNLLYAIYKVFKCGYGDELMREKLLRLVPVNVGQNDKKLDISIMALGLIARGHKYEPISNDEWMPAKYGLAALVAEARMPKTVRTSSMDCETGTNFFVSLIDPQFGDIYRCFFFCAN